MSTILSRTELQDFYSGLIREYQAEHGAGSGIEITIPASSSAAPAAQLTEGNNSIVCAVEGCTNAFYTTYPLSENARFICKHHPRASQIRAAGRIYNPETDHADEVHFQDYAFDTIRGADPQSFEKSEGYKGKALSSSDVANRAGYIEQDSINEVLAYEKKMRRKAVA